MTQERLDFCDGKYTVINDNGVLTALRNGEPWDRDLVGDNLVFWMFVGVQRLNQIVHDKEQETLNYSAGMNAQLRINERLQQHKEALAGWLEKTEWARKSVRAHELGMHGADVLKARIDRKDEILRQSFDAMQWVRKVMLRNAPELAGKAWGNLDLSIDAIKQELGT